MAGYGHHVRGGRDSHDDAERSGEGRGARQPSHRGYRLACTMPGRNSARWRLGDARHSAAFGNAEFPFGGRDPPVGGGERSNESMFRLLHAPHVPETTHLGT